MNKSVHERTPFAERLSREFLGRELNSFKSALEEKRYSPATVYLYVRECDFFRCWLESVDGTVNRSTVDRYLSQVVCFTKSARARRRPQTRPAIFAFFSHLGESENVSASDDDRSMSSNMEQCLTQYREYMSDVAGLAPRTQERYCLYAARFLAKQFQGDSIEWSKLAPTDIFEFVCDSRSLGKGHSSQRVAESIRPFLRYLAFKGEISSGLINMIPGRKRRPQSIPQTLNETDLVHLVARSISDTSAGRRNYAILLLVAKLGLRAGEVLKLQIDDIDWRRGSLLIRAGKTHQERTLPLPKDVAEAVLSYLQHGRPHTMHRRVFIAQQAPYQPLRSPAVTRIIKALLDNAGIVRHRSGAHLLRHTLATRMVNQGVSFFDVADVLGHKSLRSTVIYAKLDMERLSQVAMPWIGGDK